MTDCARLYTRPFTTRNQDIKRLEKQDQTIKEDESSYQAIILTIKILDRCRRWKYRAHSSNYPSVNAPGWLTFHVIVLARIWLYSLYFSLEEDTIFPQNLAGAKFNFKAFYAVTIDFRGSSYYILYLTHACALVHVCVFRIEYQYTEKQKCRLTLLNTDS